MRRLPRIYVEARPANACPRCGKIHIHCGEGCPCERSQPCDDEDARSAQREQRHEHHHGAPCYQSCETCHDQCRCPKCGHGFAWSPAPCARCGKPHGSRQPWISPGASSFAPEIIDRPVEGGFSRLFGDNSMLGALMMLSLFGGGLGGISEIRQLFMHPMFQLLEIINNMKNGGNLLEALGPVLSSQDVGALGDILAGLNKNNVC